MQVKKIAAVLAIATLSAGAMADTFTSEGLVQSAPAYNVGATTLTRAEVQNQAAQAVRTGIVNTQVAEGVRQPAPMLASERSRESVRAEAAQAARKAYATRAQLNEGLAG
ncbi:MAG: DUF4148 domain-containing protein [Burkholderiales bacterium]|nr:DUF4148 domain-containing protein [Burkholderiales bacterium]